MPSGYPLENKFTEATVATALKNRSGVITFAAEELECDRISLGRYIQAHPELQNLITELRRSSVNHNCDIAEDTITVLMCNRLDPKTALRAAMYYLNNQGKKRGYAHPDADKDESMTPAQAMAISGMVTAKVQEMLPPKKRPKKRAKKKPAKKRAKSCKTTSS